jgi:hypothetical protein
VRKVQGIWPARVRPVEMWELAHASLPFPGGIRSGHTDLAYWIQLYCLLALGSKCLHLHTAASHEVPLANPYT